MKYMLLIYGDEHALNDAEREQCYRESTELAHQLQAAGQSLAAAPLRPTSTAASVRVRKGKPLVTDGPFAETREQLARLGTVEVRPIVEIADVPVDHASSRSTQGRGA